MRKQLVLFDFDGTLAETLPAIKEIISEYAPSFGFTAPSQKDWEDARGKTPVEMMKMFHVPLWKLPVLLAKGRGALQKKIATVSLFSGIKAMLSELKQLNFRLGILTSNDKTVVEKYLQDQDILSYFEFVKSEFNLFGKDESMKKIGKELELSPSQILYVGDEVRDVEACKKVGIDCIAVEWGFSTREALEKAGALSVVKTTEELTDQIKKAS